ncbi:SDR family NAD(P)-dependent oxidoreductase [Nocardioides aurantiacus]|uniref:NADP-dependent 3-hydroxy acid dehydrogenase YdfG n=1 Tax=Nocardioides aurantiacus TaxID=86796 RepID=A0A3N2CY23_9ACTN|nr:SDR family NAD(P)-dependent oxidoreductase [Nocardioides aurantiacus]ROR92353.1 NADP-dependent 3-hydroxy acid dehydrogenase YdfG [Nocardioides aurantiacus]
MSRSSVADKVVVVTGAGSGIGRALVLELDRRGARVAGCDVDEAGLKETASLTRGELHTAVVDMGDREAVEAYAEDVAAHHGAVHQVYNNAGIAFTAPVIESSWADYERVLRVNLHGVIHGTQAFLPHLVDSGDGHVVNVSSLNGYLAQPGLSHYCAAKFAVRGFTETMRAEMLLAGHPVQVSVVHPGGVATAISANALEWARSSGMEVTAAHEARQRTYTEKLLKLPADKAASIIVDGVERGRPRIRVGKDAVAVDRLVRLAPATATRVAVLLERRLLKAEQQA